MTVAAGKTPLHSYFPGSAMAAEALDFEFIDSSHVVVQDSDGNTLVQGTDYSISGDGRTAAASITALVTVDPAVEWSIWTETPDEQQLDLAASAAIPREQYEKELDRQAIRTREVKRDLARAPQVPMGDAIGPLPSAAARANKFQGYDAVGDPVALSGTGADDGLRDDLADALGALLLGFVQSDAGAVARTLLAKARDIKSLHDFGGGAGGEVAAAWNAFQAAVGPKMILPGSYTVNGETKVFDNGCFGNGDVKSNLSSEHRDLIAVGIDDFISREAYICIGAEHDDAFIRPAIYVSSLIDDDSGAAADAKVAGIFSYMEQTGANTNQYPKAIAGTAVNAAAGNNDATGVVGYAIKFDVAGGIGDAAGAGGVCWQRSSEAGLAIGGEFACHMAATPTYSSGQSGSGNRSMSLHVTTNSPGGPLWAGMSFDSNGLSSGYNGYWSAINFQRSSFAQGGEGIVSGTVGLDFSSNTTTGPDKTMWLGNANHHLWRTTQQAIRVHGSTLDFERVDDGTPGMRLITPSAAFEGGYFGAYAGSTGPDGTTSVTTRGALIIDTSGYVTLRSTNQSTGATVGEVAVSPASDAFIPRGSSVSSMDVGASSARFDTYFGVNSDNISSDKRLKTDIQPYPDALLDAWGEVEHVMYRMKAAKKKKGDAARFHAGMIAQQLLAAMARHGIPEDEAMRYGFIGFDKWEAQPEVTRTERVLKKHAVHEQVLVRPEVREKIWKRPPSYERILVKPEVREKILLKPAVIKGGKVVEPAVHELGEVLAPAKYRRGKLIDPGEYEEGEVVKPAIYADGKVLEPEEYEEIPVVTPGRKAGEMYSLRYEECLCVEAAYQRRRADRSEARIAAIENHLGIGGASE